MPSSNMKQDKWTKKLKSHSMCQEEFQIDLRITGSVRRADAVHSILKAK